MDSTEPKLHGMDSTEPKLHRMDSTEPKLHRMDSTELTAEDQLLLSTIEKLNTKKCTQWTLTTWKTWKVKKNSEAVDSEVIPSLYKLMTMSDQDIDYFLAWFIKDLKRSGGGEYPFDSIKNIVFGIQRYAKAFAMVNKTVSLMVSGNFPGFPRFNKAMKDKRMMLRKVGIGNKANRKRALGISLAQEEGLWNKHVFGCYTAKVLSNTMFFYVSKIFGFVAGAGLRLLKTEHFTFSEDEYGKYVELDTSFTRENVNDTIFNRCHGIEMPATGRLRQYCNPSNPRTFYNILQQYIDKRNSFMSLQGFTQANGVVEDTSLFLMPKDGIAFSNHPIGKNSLQQKFSKIMHAAGMRGNYTNQALVLSVNPRLLAKGYDVRQRRFFPPMDHVEICKLLDPPPGPLPADVVQCETKAILQLVTLPQARLDQSSQLESRPQASLDRSSQMMSLPQSSNLVTSAESVQGAANSVLQLVPFTMTGTNNFQQNGPLPIFLQQLSAQNTGTSSIPNSPSNNTIHNLRKKLKANKPQATATETFGSSQQDIKSEAATDNTLPLFLSMAGDNQATQSDDAQPNIVIKCEPVDDFDEDGIHNIVAATGNCYNGALNETDPYKAESDGSVLQNSKRKHESETDKMETYLSNIKKPKTSEDKSVETDSTEVHVAKVEYSFSNDLKRNSVKQEVCVNDDDQTLFSFSATNKMGKSLNDLDLNLGDYLPDDCVLKPGNINLKRVVTPEGGKLIIQVTYETDS